MLVQQPGVETVAALVAALAQEVEAAAVLAPPGAEAKTARGPGAGPAAELAPEVEAAFVLLPGAEAAPEARQAAVLA